MKGTEDTNFAMQQVNHNSFITLHPWIQTPVSPRPHTINSLSYNTVVLYSRDRYEIIGLRKSSHSIKQPCNSICLTKAFAMHQSC